MADTGESEPKQQTENADDEENRTQNDVTDMDNKTEDDAPKQHEDSDKKDARPDRTADDVDKDKEEKETDKQDSETKPAMSIDLNKMKSLYQFRSRPTLPYLLTEYGMEDKNAPSMKKKEQKKKKKHRSFGDDTGRDMERERMREERHLQIVQDMYKLRDYYFEEYLSLLQSKVDRQRHDIRQRSNALHSKIQEKEEAERRDSHKVKQRLDRHTLASDDHFKKHIPKTDLFYITQLQDKLVKEGKLKTQSDFEHYWENIQRPDVFYATFKVHKSDGAGQTAFQNGALSESSFGPSSMANSTHAGTMESLPQAQLARGLTLIPESRETSRPGTRTDQSWAITQQFPSQHKAPDRSRRRLSFTGLKLPSSHPPKQTYLQELEKRFPKMEMPKLHCFTMDLGPKAADPAEEARARYLQQRERERKVHMNKINRMHQMAMAHAAAANRILDMHEDMDFVREGFQLPDVISDFLYMESPSPQPGRIPEADQTALALRPSSEPLPAEPGSLSPVAEQDSKPSTRESSRRSGRSAGRRSGWKKEGKKAIADRPHSEVEKPHKLMPLSLDEVTTKTIEAKCLSTLWTNYMKYEPMKT